MLIVSQELKKVNNGGFKTENGGNNALIESLACKEQARRGNNLLRLGCL